VFAFEMRKNAALCTRVESEFEHRERHADKSPCLQLAAGSFGLVAGSLSWQLKISA
jgi:hypothetical protein